MCAQGGKGYTHMFDGLNIGLVFERKRKYSQIYKIRDLWPVRVAIEIKAKSPITARTISNHQFFFTFTPRSTT